MSDIQNEDYKEKDLVWARIKGYPWWPSQISQISLKPITTLGKNTKEKIFTIEMIGEKNIVKVSSEKIEPFIKNYDKHANTKNTSLLKSIEIAKKIYEKNFKKEKENEEQNKNNNDNKDNNMDNSAKFLQKKRNNERIILDDEQNGEDKNIKMKTNEEQNENMLSTPKNNIKINININLTTNNQHTINLNSFQTKDAMNQTNPNPNITTESNKKNIPKFSSFNYTTLPANEKTGNKNSNKKEKIFNTNTDSNSKEKILLEEGEGKKIKSLKKEKNSEEKEDDLKLEEISKNNDNEESLEENENSECEEDNEELILTNDIINESIQKILNCQVQISNLSSQKAINKELVDLSEKFHQLFSKNQNEIDNYEIYYLSRDLIPILMNLTYNKNTDIMSKSSEILSFLNEKIIKEIFNLSQKDQNDLIESLQNKTNEIPNSDNSKNDINLEEDEFKEGLNIVELINKKITIKSGISDIHTIYSKRGRPKKISINSELSSDIFSSKINDGFFNINNNTNEKNYYDEFVKILSIKDKTKMESDFQELIGDFFENTYDKNNSDLDIDLAKLRKNMCIKLYKILKKIFPEIKKDLLKKMIIYFEYKIRNSNNDKIYSIKIKELAKVIKGKLYDNDKVK